MDRQEILSKLRERIVAFAASRISRDFAEDLAQEVLMVLEERYPLVDRAEELLPLSLRIARFKILSFRRKVYRRGEDRQVSVDEIPLPNDDFNPLATYERREMLERLERALAGMGARCRELFRLKLEGKTFPEIQLLMAVGSINTIYTWDSRCRQELLKRIGGSWEKPE